MATLIIKKHNLKYLGLMLFILVSGLILSNRYYFDDELFNINIMTHYSLLDILTTSKPADPSLALPFAINKLFYNHFPLSIFLPAIFINILSLFYLFISFEKKLNKLSSKIFLSLFTFLNPSILMWCIGIRWYAYWTPLFLIAFVLLFVQKKRKYTIHLCTLIFVMLTYMSYLSLIVIPVTYLNYFLLTKRRYLGELIFSVISYLLLISYQVYILFTVHMVNADMQRLSILKSFFITAMSIFTGSAIFPFEPVAVIFSVTIFTLLFIYIFRVLNGEIKAHELFIPLLIFFIINIILLTFSELGGKARNSIYLNVLLMMIVPIIIDTMDRKYRALILVIGAIFLVFNINNLINQKNTIKSSINLPMEDLLKHVSSVQKSEDQNIFIYTHDSVISYYLDNDNYKLLSYYGLVKDRNSLFHGKKGDIVIILETYHGSIGENFYQKNIKGHNEIIAENLTNIEISELGYDKWYKIKSYINGGPVPEYLVNIIKGNLLDDYLLTNYIQQPSKYVKYIN